MDCNTKIIIVDDHPMFREVMKLIIEKEGIGVVIAEAENGKAFLDLLENFAPDLTLMDIDMPVMGGMEATIKAKAHWPDIKILALTQFGDRGNYTSMIHAGAVGYVVKTSGKQELEKAINKVVGGESYFSKELLRQLIINAGRQLSSSATSVAVDNKFTEREFRSTGISLQWFYSQRNS